MSKKMLQFIVIFLAILIIICFLTLIYGMYLKISKNQSKQEDFNNLYSLNLNENEKIIGIETLNESNILFKITDSKNSYAIIFDIKTNTVKSKIKR
tara:strand:+ start:137 stop:424 length:288 start_codon:yes stop_codon:yes gene_type:complete